MEAGDGIALDLLLPLGFGPIELLVVGERVRIGPDYMTMHECRTVAGANVVDSGLERAIADQGISAVEFGKVEIRKTADQLADVSASRADFDGNGDGVLVVFDHEQHRELQVGSGVERLPELAFTSGAVAAGNEHDFVAVKDHVLELAVVAGRSSGQLRRSPRPAGTAFP